MDGWLAGWTDRSNGWQDGWMDGRASRCRSGSASPYQSVTVATAAPCRTIAAQRAQVGLTQAGHSQPENGVGPIRAGGLDAPRVGVAVGLWERKGRAPDSQSAEPPVRPAERRAYRYIERDRLGQGLSMGRDPRLTRKRYPIRPA